MKGSFWYVKIFKTTHEGNQQGRGAKKKKNRKKDQPKVFARYVLHELWIVKQRNDCPYLQGTFHL